LESVSIVDAKVLTTAADDHLGIPFPWLVQLIACVQVVRLLTLIVSVTDQNEPVMQLQLSDLRFCELTSPELFGDHVLLRLVDSRQVDMERDRASLLVGPPQAALEFSVECGLACSRIYTC